MADAPTATKSVSQEEQDIILSGPALYANKIYLTALQAGVRITFAEEQPGTEPVFRTAVFLVGEDVPRLRDLLNIIIARAKTVEINAGQADAKSSQT